MGTELYDQCKQLFFNNQKNSNHGYSNAGLTFMQYSQSWPSIGKFYMGIESNKNILTPYILPYSDYHPGTK